LPFSPLAHTFGFTALPGTLLAVIAVMIPAYLLLLEVAKTFFYRAEAKRAPEVRRPLRQPQHRIARRASRWLLPRRHWHARTVAQ
ncbi:MAG TPA: hypothetical protein VMT74_02320, partial [Gaiellaceae bacterium]|nr:hypothetical protein [Gaiellaceae bacterium]